MGRVIGQIMLALKSRAFAKSAIITGAVAVLSDFFNIDLAREEAVRVSPTSDPEGLEFAARAIHWMMGLTDQSVVGPRDIRNWNYFHYDPRKGRGWWTRTYTSKRATSRAWRKGTGRGFGRGWNRARQTRELAR